DVALVVLVDDVGALGMLDEQRGAADALECAHRRVHAAGDVLLGLVEEDFGTGHGKPRKSARVLPAGPGQEEGNSETKARALRSTSAGEFAANRPLTTARSEERRVGQRW